MAKMMKNSQEKLSSRMDMAGEERVTLGINRQKESKVKSVERERE